MLEELKRAVYESNMKLVEWGLVTLTWGNVSGIDRDQGLIVIKPSGVEYENLTPEDMVVVDMEGNIIEGKWRPSVDTPTHLVLYRSFQEIGGVAHTHSEYATAFAQAGKPIECLGTTHADYFYGTIPVTRFLTEIEINGDYETATGNLIVETFRNIDPLTMPGVLIAGHGPFTWGKTPVEAVQNSLILEKVAQIAFRSILLNEKVKCLPEYILKKHFLRKHGVSAYYGQQKKIVKKVE